MAFHCRWWGHEVLSKSMFCNVVDCVLKHRNMPHFQFSEDTSLEDCRNFRNSLVYNDTELFPPRPFQQLWKGFAEASSRQQLRMPSFSPGLGHQLPNLRSLGEDLACPVQGRHCPTISQLRELSSLALPTSGNSRFLLRCPQAQEELSVQIQRL